MRQDLSEIIEKAKKYHEIILRAGAHYLTKEDERIIKGSEKGLPKTQRKRVYDIFQALTSGVEII